MLRTQFRAVKSSAGGHMRNCRSRTVEEGRLQNQKRKEKEEMEMWKRTRPKKCACPVQTAVPDEMCVPNAAPRIRPAKCAFPRCLVVVFSCFFTLREKTKTGSAANQDDTFVTNH